MMSTEQRTKFKAAFPNGFFIDAQYQGLETYLKDCAILSDDERIATIEKAGEGNMNLTLRVVTSAANSVIVKQGRPWVEKYPQIEAPADRALVEAYFYKATQKHAEIAKRMPHLKLLDASSGIMVLSDLGSLIPLDILYTDNSVSFSDEVWTHLGDWLGELHSMDVPQQYHQNFQNQAMRRLNHLHIYQLPFQPDNGIALNEFSEGLQDAAQYVLGDDVLKRRISDLGAIYLAEGTVLLHGDYYPGSWLLNDVQRPFIIDPEFCFLGNCPEFDLGIAYAHLHICGISATAWKPFWEAYHEKQADTVDLSLVKAFAGVEILRRLLGVAQLPILHTTEQRLALLQEAVGWIML